MNRSGVIGALFLGLALTLWVAGCATQKPEPKGEEPAKTAKADSHIKMGDVHLREGKYRMAMKQYMLADKLKPNDPELKFRIALVYADHYKRYADAISYYKEAIRLRENYAEAYNNLGYLYLLEKRWDDAIPMFRKALENIFYPTPEKAYYNMAIAYREKGEAEKAIENFLMAIDLKKNFPPLYIELGRYYMELGRYRDALGTFHRVRSIIQKVAPKPGKASSGEVMDYRATLAGVYLFEGRCLAKLERYTEARAALENALATAPDEDTRKRVEREIEALPEAR